ncbi:MAG: PmoA family protein [Planctomycetes bacterium]|nr:PmoA family protein [Planctomycetota bacterium]
MQKLIPILIRSIPVFLLSCCFLSSHSVTYGQSLGTITVEAGDYTRIDTPVSLDLSGMPLGFPADRLHLVEIKGSRRVVTRVQLEAGSPPRLWWILSGRTEAGSTRIYDLKSGSRGVDIMYGDAAELQVVKNDSFLQIQQEDGKILRYNHAVVPAPAGQSALYNRSGFIHPLWSPTGSVLTNIHPKDHYHHLGIWMPWTHTEFEGKPVDFWNLGQGQGTVRFKKFVSMTGGSVYGGFQAEQEHVALKTDEGAKVVLNEVWDVRVYNIGGPGSGYWLWDFVSTQRCVAESPLKLLEYRYGGFGFRATADWKGEMAAYLTSTGKTRKDGHATRARWCDTSGVSDGKWKGVTFFSHPGNFRHPEAMRIWPEFEKEVFFNWAPVQTGDFEMKPGADHVFRYRQYVHEGKVDVERTEQVWNDYAHPPEITLDAAPPKSVVVLFDGRHNDKEKDFSHWTAGDNKKIGWDSVDGVMKIAPRTGSIWTKRNFTDFKMHLEFKIPQMPPNVKGQGRGNSGVYIQRRYELQILDSYGLQLQKNDCASMYKTKAPDKNVCKMPQQWQSYDIIFGAAKFDGNKKTKNARITVWHNGILVHDDFEIPNKTGAGQEEGPEPGPILLQDHGNEVSFRNIWIVPL